MTSPHGESDLCDRKVTPQLAMTSPHGESAPMSPPCDKKVTRPFEGLQKHQANQANGAVRNAPLWLGCRKVNTPS